jgi:hypothetical protein
VDFECAKGGRETAEVKGRGGGGMLAAVTEGAGWEAIVLGLTRGEVATEDEVVELEPRRVGRWKPPFEYVCDGERRRAGGGGGDEAT